MPVLWASTTAWTRSRRSSLRRTVVTWVLTVVSVIESSAPISAFEKPRAMRRKTSISRAVSSSTPRRRGGTRAARELSDDPLRDRGGQQRLAARDGPDRRDELLRRVVLEHEAA